MTRNACVQGSQTNSSCWAALPRCRTHSQPGSCSCSVLRRAQIISFAVPPDEAVARPPCATSVHSQEGVGAGTVLLDMAGTRHLRASSAHGQQGGTGTGAVLPDEPSLEHPKYGWDLRVDYYWAQHVQVASHQEGYILGNTPPSLSVREGVGRCR